MTLEKSYKAKEKAIKAETMLERAREKTSRTEFKVEKFRKTLEEKKKKSFQKKVAPYKKFLKAKLKAPKSSPAWRKRMAVRFAPPTENSSYLHGSYLNNPSDKPMLGWSAQEGRKNK
jgi:hypothetical protein